MNQRSACLLVFHHGLRCETRYGALLAMTAARGEPARVWLRVMGRVQGVGFRFSAVDEARRLGVTGWVRNTPDGSVELVAEGERACLQRLVSWSHSGPAGALVRSVEEQWLPHTGEFDRFRIVF